MRTALGTRLRPHVALLTTTAMMACAIPSALLPTNAFAQGRAGAAPGAQAAPQDLVSRGKALFDDQQYEESIQTLSAALLRPNNTREQRIEIYRLLALDYITLGRKDESEAAVRGLLALDPEYELPATESPRFRDFFAATKQKWEADGKPGVQSETAPPPAAVTMAHSSPSQVEHDTQIDLTARLNDPQHRVSSVVVFFRAGSKGKFEEVEAQLDGNVARATIPASAVRPPLVEYYIEGDDAGGLAVVTRGDAAAPFRIAVPEPAKGWILPVAIGGGVLGAAAIVGGLALAGVFKGSSGGGTGPSGGPRSGTVSITISQ